jgi:hypothetical protein
MHRSASRRIAPTGTHVHSIRYDARDGRIAARDLQHLSLACLIVLSIIFGKLYRLSRVVVACLLAIRTTGFGVQN